VPTLPFRFSHVAEWLRNPSPTLGQHNDEVLGAIGVSAEERDALRARHVIGERLVGT
jgi:crotonobetainyl-CoA:carnitine CoA-transferase CaiB-like acyl-CoA transferase